MTRRHFRHQAPEQRTEQTRQRIDQSRALGDAQQAEPERQRAEQEDHDLDRQLRHVEQARDHRGEDAAVAADEPARERGDRRRQEEAEPEPVEHAPPSRAMREASHSATRGARRERARSGTLARWTDKPFAPACERNRDPILAVLRAHFADRARVLEIGSGTGQHAVYFAAAMPYLVWQTSDVSENLPGIRAWLAEAKLSNTPPPIELDVAEGNWPRDALRRDLQREYAAHHELARSRTLFAALPAITTPTRSSRSMDRSTTAAPTPARATRRSTNR